MDHEHLGERIERLERTVFGHDESNGIRGRVKSMESILYRNKNTGSPGLVQQVAKIQWIIYLLLFSIAQDLVPLILGWFR